MRAAPDRRRVLKDEYWGVKRTAKGCRYPLFVGVDVCAPAVPGFMLCNGEDCLWRNTLADRQQLS